ncbi:hypothetical protein HPB47_022345 [Ixodes persulcatus]|uniref:Uncharacterized protein n=1 Tax=Ixodes persulcatus TaxID=34615 RepID=A0AC60QCA1_IXOPE|nr:hypothetical protein HPB47_022345 [Ixodes persulcatus]
MVSFVVQAGALISVSTIRSFLFLALGSFLVGLGRGVRCFLFPVLVSDHCRLDDMPAALSIMNAVCSAVLFLRTPLIGYARDNSGSYATLFIGLAAINVIQLIVWLVYARTLRTHSG